MLDEVGERLMWRMRVTFFVVLLLAAIIGGGWWVLRRVEPSGPPTYVGRINVDTTYGGDFLLVPMGGTFQNSVSIVIRRGAPVHRRDGRPAVLANNQRVSVWCSGPQAESMPPKSVADRIVIESDEP